MATLCMATLQKTEVQKRQNLGLPAARLRQNKPIKMKWHKSVNVAGLRYHTKFVYDWQWGPGTEAPKVQHLQFRDRRFMADDIGLINGLK